MAFIPPIFAENNPSGHNTNNKRHNNTTATTTKVTKLISKGERSTVGGEAGSEQG